VAYDKILFIMEPVEQAKAAIGKRVTVVDYPDGRLSVAQLGASGPRFAPEIRGFSGWEARRWSMHFPWALGFLSFAIGSRRHSRSKRCREIRDTNGLCLTEDVG
jgi:hypothetical protein